MSKSLGNFVTIHDLLHTEKFGGRSWPGEALRLAMLRTHYRQPIDWTVKALEEANTTCVEWYLNSHDADPDAVAPDEIILALLDDLNVHAAFTSMHELNRKARKGDRSASAKLRAALDLLGIELKHEHWKKFLILKRNIDDIDNASLNELILEERESFLASVGKTKAEIDALIRDRLAARAEKNWAESDRIRDQLAAMGVMLKDNKDGTTTWEINRDAKR